MNRFFASFAVLCIALGFGCGARGESKRIRLSPQLLPGQAFEYLVNFQSSRDIKTESRVIVPNLPSGEKRSALGRIHVVVLGREDQGIRLRTELRLSAQNSSSLAHAPGDKPAEKSPSPAAVEFLLLNDGSAARITGLDMLSADEQAAWREWLARFAASMTYPRDGVRPGDKWESQEREAAPAPIAGLVWLKRFEYVRDEPCPFGQPTPKNDLIEATNAAETCAVILTTSVLKQKSSRKDATPEDYRLNHLHTSGIATGRNETILYISRSNGLLMHSSETATQSMDVTIALAGSDNKVHYDIRAESRARLLILQSGAP